MKENVRVVSAMFINANKCQGNTPGPKGHNKVDEENCGIDESFCNVGRWEGTMQQYQREESVWNTFTSWHHSCDVQ